MIHMKIQFYKKCYIVLCFSSTVLAGEETGVEILDTCLSEHKAMMGDPVNSVRYGLCLGYLKGVADNLNGYTVCLPENMSKGVITRVLKRSFLAYSQAHQNQLSEAAKKTVVPALMQAFPCTK
ncbi:MAG: hypothetical protein DIZ80_07715 [endosymbiont of Galathealinum brachiosum]|uniref:Rap1a immunity protein domain-containing protein n=1 Tax=endosymbiont of Galathealinum brachiosum TaxID=2200906 RepID=A0A370DGP9_9GAMM|nr:MAG: hypothetical protein DIZ80_07715 [endosymbiont of Galathealinum brachiosum]